MNQKTTYILLFVFLFMAFTGLAGGLSKKEIKRIDKILADIWQDDSISYEKIDLSMLDKNNKKACAQKRFFRIMKKGNKPAYFCLSSAMGRYEYFDHIVVVNDALDIEKVQVLAYRSDHGYEITSKKWLSQFVGFTGGAVLEYDNDISAISGATISGTSITHDINNIMEIFRFFEKNGILEPAEKITAQ